MIQQTNPYQGYLQLDWIQTDYSLAESAHGTSYWSHKKRRLYGDASYGAEETVGEAALPEEPEQETAVIQTVSDDQCKITVSSDEAEINEVLQEDNDHSDETDPDELSVESNGEDSPAGDDGLATVESADMERPYTELFYAETDGIPE